MEPLHLTPEERARMEHLFGVSLTALRQIADMVGDVEGRGQGAKANEPDRHEQDRPQR